MTTNVNNAFSEFLEEKVRIDPERTKIARSSKGWLIEQIKGFASDGKFPMIHPDISIDYGSFSRKTKIRPLDDIDLMVILHAQGATYMQQVDHIAIYNNGSAAQLSSLCNDDGITINSIKIINKFKEYLAGVPQYRSAIIKRNQEAVTHELTTYEWSYDIVPCFRTNAESDGRTYYLIPDGKGNWKKTDPRIDRQRVVTINSKQVISVLDVIRLLKYWNKRPTMPSMSSYMLETMVLDYYETAVSTQFVDMEAIYLLRYISQHIHSAVNDPKGIQGNLNTLSYEQREKIHIRAQEDYAKAVEARQLEADGNMKAAIAKWALVFGTEFPPYTL